MFLRLRARAAFTIVELLVASAITVLIVVLLGTMFGSLTTTSNRANQRIDAFRDARAALQMIERDMANLVHAVPTAYFALDKRWQDTANDPYSDSANGNANRQVYGLIALKNSGPGDLCAVGYYCRWDTTTHSYSLYRYFTDSTATFNTLQTNGLGVYAPASKLFTPAVTDAVLAAYVWNLQILAYKADGTVDTTYPLVINPAAPAVTVPAAIEISFTAMSPEAARTIMGVSTDPADWMDSTKPRYKLLIAPRAYEFRTRISF